MIKELNNYWGEALRAKAKKGRWMGEKAAKQQAHIWMGEKHKTSLSSGHTWARHGEREARIAEGCRMHMAYTAKKYQHLWRKYSILSTLNVLP
jgi:hypothetical protein